MGALRFYCPIFLEKTPCFLLLQPYGANLWHKAISLRNNGGRKFNYAISPTNYLRKFNNGRIFKLLTF